LIPTKLARFRREIDYNLATLADPIAATSSDRNRQALGSDVEGNGSGFGELL